jgi:hypothetical protein
MSNGISVIPPVPGNGVHRSGLVALLVEQGRPLLAWPRSPPIAGPSWLSRGARPEFAFRLLVIACQAASLLITWPLWSSHASPPMLPALPLPHLELSVPLLLSLLLALLSPLRGVLVHTVLLGYAMLVDQTRLQPEFVSLAFLLWGSLPYRQAQHVARAHLISMWIFSGLNKLLSPAFFTGSAQWMLLGLLSRPPQPLRDSFAYVVILSEASIGLLSLMPSTRPAAAVLALWVHANILLILSPLAHGWNQAVWPWNVALGLSGFFLIKPWRDTLAKGFSQCSIPTKIVVAALCIFPAGFYFLVSDAYLSHNLYSDNTPREFWCNAAGVCSVGRQAASAWRAFNVPMPPEHRLYSQYFRATCQPGERLVIEDSRAWAYRQGLAQQVIACPAG